MISPNYTCRLRLSLDGLLATLVKLDQHGRTAETVRCSGSIPNALEFLAEALGIRLSDADAILLGVEMRHEDEVDVGITTDEYAALATQWAQNATGAAQAA